MKREISYYFGRDELYAVIFGGRGSEHAVSRMGAENFISVAQRLGFDILPIFIGKSGEFYVYLGSTADIECGFCEEDSSVLYPTYPVRLFGQSGFFACGSVISVVGAVPLLHGDFGEDGVVQGALETAGIKYVGADTVSGALMRDKTYAKSVALRLGVPTLPWLDFQKKDVDISGINEVVAEVARRIGYPVFVKPCRLGSSVGASLARKEGELFSSIELAFSVSDRIMAERALLSKRELECAYFDVGSTQVISEPGEVDLGGGFYDYRRKYLDTDSVKLIPRADIPACVGAEIKQYTKRLAGAFGARHLARFDYFLSDGGEVYFNETNSFPGMTRASLYAAMLGESGISFESFVKRLLTEAW